MKKNLYYVIGYWYTLNEDDHSKVLNESRLVVSAYSAEDALKYFINESKYKEEWRNEVASYILAGAYNKEVVDKDLLGETFRIEVLPLTPDIVVE